MADEIIEEKQGAGETVGEPVELTDEELDRIADTAIAALQDIFKYFNVGEVTIDEYEGDEGELILDITGDDLAVLIGGVSAKSYSSQGQTRTAALSIKLAEREIYKNTVGEYPVLLLDDVLSELDARRQEFVLNRIQGGQVFITCCEDDRLGALLKGKVFHIADGQVV